MGNFSKAVLEALKEAEVKSENLKGEIESSEFQKENTFIKSPPKEWINYRLKKLHETLSKNTVSSASVLKEVLGTIQLEPISDKESDFYQIINGDEKKFKPYYIAHTKIQTLALLEMSYQQIAKSLNVNKRTAIRACASPAAPMRQVASATTAINTAPSGVPPPRISSLSLAPPPAHL